MIATDAPRGSDQAVTRARTMIQACRAIVIVFDCEATDLAGSIIGNVGVSGLSQS